MNAVDVATSPLNALESEIVAIFVRMADVLNLPRSVGEIYGLLFVSPEPLCLDDCRGRLNISKGSTSQGLKILRSFGAVRTVYVPGDRKDYYQAETSLRKMAAGFASEQIQPHLAGGAERMARIRELLERNAEEERGRFEEKLDLLENWHRRAGRALPLVLKLIGG